MAEFSLSEINERISREAGFVDTLREAVSATIVGQTLSLIHISEPTRPY